MDVRHVGVGPWVRIPSSILPTFSLATATWNRLHGVGLRGFRLFLDDRQAFFEPPEGVRGRAEAVAGRRHPRYRSGRCALFELRTDLGVAPLDVD